MIKEICCQNSETSDLSKGKKNQSETLRRRSKLILDTRRDDYIETIIDKESGTARSLFNKHLASASKPKYRIKE
jgi:hypothetical protein